MINKLKFDKEKGVFFVTDKDNNILRNQCDLTIYDKLSDLYNCKIGDENCKRYIKQVTVTFDVVMDLDDLYLND